MNVRFGAQQAEVFALAVYIHQQRGDVAEHLQADAAPVDPADVCLLYTSDAADERSSVDLGGRRIIKKKKSSIIVDRLPLTQP